MPQIKVTVALSAAIWNTQETKGTLKEIAGPGANDM
jgi:hypothetical protein